MKKTVHLGGQGLDFLFFGEYFVVFGMYFWCILVDVVFFEVCLDVSWSIWENLFAGFGDWTCCVGVSFCGLLEQIYSHILSLSFSGCDSSLIFSFDCWV